MDIYIYVHYIGLLYFAISVEFLLYNISDFVEAWRKISGRRAEIGPLSPQRFLTSQ